MKVGGSVGEFEAAWRWREARGLFGQTEALRIFHGPGEGSGARRSWAIDRFAGHYWVTRWNQDAPGARDAGDAQDSSERQVLDEIVTFLRGKNAESVVRLGRPRGELPALPEVLHGHAPSGRFEVREQGARFWVQLLEARHPGLFLDHAPLRQWLGARAKGWKVLNTFAYTGSLSIAAARGGAASVTTLDLSKATVQWAEDNWKLNGFSTEAGRFIAGDVFEWLPRLKREGQVFDCVILDPPSFSRGKKATFSTAKDLKKLHELALDLLPADGVLVTSINSANISWAKYESEVFAATRAKGFEARVLGRIDLPDTFPTPLGDAEARYLKGWMLRMSRK